MYHNMKQNTKTTKAARKTSHRQWRSQECELGGPPSPPLALLTGVRGYNPGNFV